jgi:HEAT repeat protein/transposase-like protein
LGDRADKQAVEPIFNLLTIEQEKSVIEVAVTSLEKIGDNLAIEVLIKLLNKHKSYVGIYAATSLGNIGNLQSIVALVEQLENKDLPKDLREHIVNILRQSEAITEKLITLVQDKKAHLWDRKSAALGLGYIGNTQIIEILVSILQDKTEDSHLHHSVASALTNISGEDVIKLSIDNLTNSKIPDDSRVYFVEILGKNKTTSAVELLISIFQNKKEGDFLRQKAIEALGEIQDRRAVTPLIAILQNKKEDENLREEAANSLGKIKDISAVEPLVSSLKSEKGEYTRGWLARALGEIGDNRAVQPLINILIKEEGDDLISQVVEALGKIGDKRASILLAITFFNADVPVQNMIATVLHEFTGIEGAIALIEMKCPHCSKSTKAILPDEAEERQGFIEIICQECERKFNFKDGMLYKPLGTIEHNLVKFANKILERPWL